MDQVTVLVCSHNTNDLTANMILSLRKWHNWPVVVIDTGNEQQFQTDDNNVMIYVYTNAQHGPAVNLGLRKIETHYCFLVDSDIVFLRTMNNLVTSFSTSGSVIGGKIVGDVAGKKLHPRIEPWFCLIDTEQLNLAGIQFFCRDRTLRSKQLLGGRVYDIGSTMYEDASKLQSPIAHFDAEGKYYYHLGGGSWHIQKFNANNPDTDIDFGGTHPHHQLIDIAVARRNAYDQVVARILK